MSDNIDDILGKIRIGEPLPDELKGAFDIALKESLEKGKNGDEMGMINIALSYANGTNGYPQSYKKAIRILKTVIDLNGNWKDVAELHLKEIKQAANKKRLHVAGAIFDFIYDIFC